MNEIKISIERHAAKGLDLKAIVSVDDTSRNDLGTTNEAHLNCELGKLVGTTLDSFSAILAAPKGDNSGTKAKRTSGPIGPEDYE